MLDLRDELEFALELAASSGEIALRYLREGEAALQTVHKPNGEGLVTRADTEVNEHICHHIARRFPGDAILAEESPPHDGWQGTARCWHVDPIDGTQEYASAQPSWAVHIGLAVEGRAVLGVVHEPAPDRTSWGVVEPEPQAWIRVRGGSRRPLRPSDRGPGQWRLTSSKSHASPKTDQIMAALCIAPDQNHRAGSVGVKLSRVARGAADVYAHPSGRTKLWDSCAPEAVLVAAGGTLSDLHGSPLCYGGPNLRNARGLLATHGPHHQAIVERLAPLVAQWGPL